LSPDKATRRAERVAKDAAQRRKEKRRSVMLIIGVAVASVGLLVADYFWLRHQAKQKHERHHQHQQRSKLTNHPASQAPQFGQNQATNHE
jgi:flagellar basal body-associated protein FliL